ncbi:unnamed protein product [Pleuronectes platessa]|uniref:SRC kinase signaling inhibitor 1 n=1 Tax=Pleuronectes platessa TaxID=8262 RepID=A0A9N7TRT1_PLEPL|nr:unnamed protein product [Pleuronectes platessa]
MPPPPSISTQVNSVGRLQMQLHLHGLQQNASDLRKQLGQLRKTQVENQASVKTLLKRTEAELNVRVADALRKQEDPLQRQRLLVEEERLKYLNEEELIIQQLHDLEKSVEEIQKESSVNHKLVTVQELEEKATLLRKLGETLTELKNQFPGLQSKMRVVLRVEVEAVKFLKEEPHRLDALLKRCKSVTDTLATMRKQANEGVWKKQEDFSSSSSKHNDDLRKFPDFDIPTSPALTMNDLGGGNSLANWSPHSSFSRSHGNPSGPHKDSYPPVPHKGRALEELERRAAADKALSVEVRLAAERDWEEKRASLTQYSAQDINRLLEETQAELLKAIPDLDFAAKHIKPSSSTTSSQNPQSGTATPEHRVSKPQHKLSGKEGSRRGSDELTVPRYRTEKPSKSPPPPPPRRSFPTSPGLITRIGEPLTVGKSIKKSESDETEGQKPHTKLRRSVSENPRPASTPPTLASGDREEGEEERIAAELETCSPSSPHVQAAGAGCPPALWRWESPKITYCSVTHIITQGSQITARQMDPHGCLDWLFERVPLRLKVPPPHPLPVNPRSRKSEPPRRLDLWHSRGPGHREKEVSEVPLGERPLLVLFTEEQTVREAYTLLYSLLESTKPVPKPRVKSSLGSVRQSSLAEALKRGMETGNRRLTLHNTETEMIPEVQPGLVNSSLESNSASYSRTRTTEEVRRSTYKRLDSLEETIRELENTLIEFGGHPSAEQLYAETTPAQTTSETKRPPVPPKPTSLNAASTQGGNVSSVGKVLHTSATSKLKHLQQNSTDKTKGGKREDFLKIQGQQQALETNRTSGSIEPYISGTKTGILSSRVPSPSSALTPGQRKHPQERALPALKASSSQAKALLASLTAAGLSAEALLLSSALRHHRLLREQRASSLPLPSSRSSSPTPDASPASSSSPTTPTPSLSPSSPAPPSSLTLPSGDLKPSGRSLDSCSLDEEEVCSEPVKKTSPPATLCEEEEDEDTGERISTSS